jgi:RNA polymerase sigma-70 factor (ECF subfamily)
MKDERSLVRRMQQGDHDAFREMVERFKHNVYHLALDLSGNHHDAEDLSQEVFIKAHRAVRKFRGGSKLNTWLYRITVNAFIDSQRKKSQKVANMTVKGEEDEPDPIDTVADETTGNPERAASAVRIGEHVETALQRLSEKERTVFVMRHFHDMPLKEIAETMKIAEGTVKSLLFRAIRKLREELSFYKDELGLGDQVV